MSFDFNALVKIGGQAQAQSMFTYKTDDPRATVIGSGYFNEILGTLRLYDYIIVRNATEDYMIHVNSEVLPITTDFMIRLSGGAEVSGGIVINDNTYTTAFNGQVFAADVRTKLDLNSDSVIESQAPFGTTAATFYNPTTKKIFGEFSGDFYVMRLQIEVKPAQQNGLLELELDIGGTQNTIIDETITLARGTQPFKYTSTHLYFTGDTFIANGGELFITTSVDCTIYNMNIIISRTHKAL